MTPAPGVPDVYQGAETVGFEPRRPDNRRYGDIRCWTKKLVGIEQKFASCDAAAFFSTLLRDEPPGVIKNYAVWPRLEFSAEPHTELFGSRSDYIPLFLL